MKKKSLRQRIEEYLAKHGAYVCGGTIQLLANKYTGCEPQTAGRVLRQMAEDGTIEVKYFKSKKGKDIAWYKTKHPMKKVVFRDVETKEIIATTYERIH